MNYTGYPELMGGDAVSAPNKYGTAHGYLIEHAIEFNGGWTGTAVIQASDVPEVEVVMYRVNKISGAAISGEGMNPAVKFEEVTE